MYVRACANSIQVVPPVNIASRMFGPFSQRTIPDEGKFPENVPNHACPLLSNNLANNWIFASNAAIKITGIFEVYVNFNGHLTPYPRTFPKERGISTFIAWM